ncbi:MAG TPA: 4-hydroxy-3-methylbut-2-enyl diphosphate reductase, partial [Puia sp.]|nr:4-hydroxy-3-methylbut-2-enyl diphosphate reductase [Puia sp.]
IVIIPAFGTTLETEKQLDELGIRTEKYNTTCPFVEKVWNRAEQIAQKNYTIIVHGKPKHEETRATFSHAASTAPTVVINDMNEAKKLAQFIRMEKPAAAFSEEFNNQYSQGFDAEKDLKRIGVVNQTTMLASDTQAIADFLRNTILEFYQVAEEKADLHFADTKDTLCYATNDNQEAVAGMLNTAADLAIVVGGYNSSNTSHLVELCEQKLPTYFISSEEKILSSNEILHYDFHEKREIHSVNYLASNSPTRILITSGASCPDAMVEAVIQKIVSFYLNDHAWEKMIASVENAE